MQRCRVTGLLDVAMVAAIVTGCSIWPGETTFGGAFPEEDGIAGTDIIVQDQTGTVADLVVDPEVDAPPAGEGATSHPEGILVTWTGGACDANVDFVFDRAGAGYTLTGMTINTDQVCRLIGIERRILLVMRTPIPAGTVVVTMGDRTL